MFKHGFPPQWSTFKKLIWLVGSGIAGAAAGIWKTVTGTLIHITDALASPMQKCEVTLEPIQDLHGQDSPYPAGGGKNKWALGDRTVVGVEIIAFPTPIPVGDWTFSCEITSTIQDASALLFKANADGTGDTVGVTSIAHSSGRVSNSFGITAEAKSVIMYSANAWNESQGQTTTFTNVQFETGTTATSYAPYENICPITGWTGCEVTRTGKNLYNPNAVTDNCYLSTTTGLPEAQVGYVVSDYIPVIKNQGVIIPASGTARRWFYDKNKNPVTYLSNSSNQLFTPSADGFIRVSVSKTSIFYNTYIIAYGSGSVPSEGLPTEYEPYNGTTLSVTFPETVYGGKYDFVGGEGHEDYYCYEPLNPVASAVSQTSDVATFDINFTNNNLPKSSEDVMVSNRFSESIPSNTNGRMVYAYPHLYLVISKSELSSVSQEGLADWFANNPTQFLYKLEEPTEIQLTPQPISTLNGVNNVWSNTNSDTTIIYKAQAT